MGKRAKKPICGAVIAFTGLRVAPVKAKQGRDSSEVYLFTGINIVSKTRLHHIENGHKSTSALDFGWGLPFCAVLRSANFLRQIEKNSHFCADFCRSAQKQGAFCAPFCLFSFLLFFQQFYDPVQAFLDGTGMKKPSEIPCNHSPDEQTE